MIISLELNTFEHERYTRSWPNESEVINEKARDMANLFGCPVDIVFEDKSINTLFPDKQRAMHLYAGSFQK